MCFLSTSSQQSAYIPLPVTHELSRPDHDCETAYSSNIYAVDVKGIKAIILRLSSMSRKKKINKI